MLSLFPLDGLRKAAETFGIPVPARGLSKTAQKAAIVAVFAERLADDTLSERPVLATPHRLTAQDMWAACNKESAPPIRATGPDLPHMDAPMKRALAEHVAAELEKLGGIDAIARLCAGKVASDTAHAECSGLSKRWRDRYAKAGYSGMRRLYVDECTHPDFKARELVALDAERHVFEVIRQLAGKRAVDVIEFSDEAGRQSTGKTFGPQWKVCLYLAFQLVDTTASIH